MKDNFAREFSMKMTQNGISFGKMSRATGIPKQVLLKYASKSKAIPLADEEKIRSALKTLINQ